MWRPRGVPRPAPTPGCCCKRRSGPRARRRSSARPGHRASRGSARSCRRHLNGRRDRGPRRQHAPNPVARHVGVLQCRARGVVERARPTVLARPRGVTGAAREHLGATVGDGDGRVVDANVDAEIRLGAGIEVEQRRWAPARRLADARFYDDTVGDQLVDDPRDRRLGQERPLRDLGPGHGSGPAEEVEDDGAVVPADHLTVDLGGACHQGRNLVRSPNKGGPRRRPRTPRGGACPIATYRHPTTTSPSVSGRSATPAGTRSVTRSARRSIRWIPCGTSPRWVRTA